LLRRIQAFWIDSVVIPIFVIIVQILLAQFGVEGKMLAVGMAITIIVLGPLLVSMTGGTLGHHFVGIHVKNRKTGKNINIFAAILRFIIKIPLGLFSFILIFNTKRHLAIHDLVSGSVVLVKNPSSKPKYEVLEERKIELDGFKYPSKSRRAGMMLAYTFLNVTVISILIVMFVSDVCMTNDLCSMSETSIMNVMEFILWIGEITLLFMCSRGLMPGCRRQLLIDKNS